MDFSLKSSVDLRYGISSTEVHEDIRRENDSSNGVKTGRSTLVCSLEDDVVMVLSLFHVSKISPTHIETWYVLVVPFVNSFRRHWDKVPKKEGLESMSE